jgi:hypothetical protein
MGRSLKGNLYHCSATVKLERQLDGKVRAGIAEMLASSVT